ncbi:MAG: SAM-dependent methyltransferase [Candidatus Moraniibacteriota bacterium]|nr:MAG: SAM-dependent methyltransferase [Candidatus Moranbacteria bacterium]
MDQHYTRWKKEESMAHITGWDFSHIDGRYEEEELPWNYEQIVRQYLKEDDVLLDLDTGGGEFLLRLGHQPERTYATEGFRPNFVHCQKTLGEKGIDVQYLQIDTGKSFPYPDNFFDVIINRHGNINAAEIYRVLKSDGYFITQQVGADNDREFVELLTPKAQKPFPNNTLAQSTASLEKAGFNIVKSDEAHTKLTFFDVGALVWFAKIIQWEFVDFSVDGNLAQLRNAQNIIEQQGRLEGKTHRFFVVAKK